MATSVFPGAKYATTPADLMDTSETVIYTVPDGPLAVFVTEIRCADEGGTARTVTLVATINGTDYTIVYQGAIAANTPLVIDPGPLVLLPRDGATNDQIKATASNGSVHCLVTVIEEIRQTAQTLTY